MKIGILGGTFDPPHDGHLELARQAIAALELDEVLFLPANRNPLKTLRASTPAKQRLAMVQALIHEEPRMAVCDLEVTKGGLSYTVETMTELSVAQPAEYWFLLGADALKGLPDWKQPQRLLKLCRLGVAIRPPMTENDVLVKLPPEVRERVDVIPMKPLDISSTEIRARLAQGKAPGPHLPDLVHRYIKENGLYKLQK